MPEQQPSDLEDHPPSTKLVYKVLEYADEPLTQAEIKTEAQLTQRTVYNALGDLQEIDLVESRPYTDDLRKRLYSLK
ncbi:helix-turn-helix domain-containing protein [Natrarchaeobaculum sulfurireducens]|uniref:ArsR family transcriptional regulator n=1 Tax=Natrarchaeobaculum sulfurireducens TaxID=2044521 RepID=A0A346PMQ8_9EURY|nr:MarR family transcriptional regulator [Natrarchaeobaculum sulfurireducens]AXR80803.1 hypothetical protein AArcMg_0781 [Natrarchaeobaculum sulfurireducens]